MTRARSWRSLLGSGALLLLAYLAFLIALAPATLLDTAVRSATAGRVRLAQAGGTLWSGSGQVQILDRRGHGVASKALSWSLQPRALWAGRVDFAVAIDHAASRFPVRLSLRGIELGGVDFSLPARALGVVVPRLRALDPRGEIVFHIAHFARAGDDIAVDAVATWKDASSSLTKVAPLGTYELRLASHAGALQANLRTRSGPLHLSGSGSWRGGEAPAMAVTARVVAPWRMQLVPLLRLVAVERGDGDFALQFNPPLGRAGSGTAPRKR